MIIRYLPSMMADGLLMMLVDFFLWQLLKTNHLLILKKLSHWNHLKVDTPVTLVKK